MDERVTKKIVIDAGHGGSDRPQRAQSLYGNGSDVILLSNHINAGGGDSHCVTKV